MAIRNPHAYLTKVIDGYRAECAAGFTGEYAARLRLWHAARVVCENADDTAPWLAQLRDLSLGHIRPNQIESTIRSAARA
jgi:hypothetical protein